MTARRVLIGALTLASALALTGCGGGKTVGDGDIGGAWALFAEPKIAVPEQNVCRNFAEKVVEGPSMAVFYSPGASCAESHVTETYYVLELTGEAAAGLWPPAVGNSDYRVHAEACAKQANAFLGGDWHLARVQIVAVPPSQAQWDGQGRWIRCEMFEVTDVDGTIKSRTGSLKDGLRGKKPLAISCANTVDSSDGESIEEIIFVPCAKPHFVELTGIAVMADKPYLGDEKQVEKNLDACYRVNAKYVGQTTGELDAAGGFHWTLSGGYENEWLLGDRTLRCFMGAFPDRKVTGSIKGKGPDAF